MHNVLVILLHRPFVADGHLYSTSRSISVDSFMKCASAASSISNLLRAYHRAFSTRRAPYLISYATYVAATIHSRIAARRGSDSTAHANLAICLAVFKENQETNSAVAKAAMIVESLMKKLGVAVDNISSDVLEMDNPTKGRDENQGPPAEDTRQPRNQIETETQANTERPLNPITPTLGNGFSPGSDWVDIDGIIQSFLHENDGTMRPPEPTDQPRQQWIMHQPDSSQMVMGHNNFAMQNQVPIAQDVTPGMPPAESYNGYQWQNGWKPANSESASLEDPLFGFNGASTDTFAFMGW